MKEFAKAAARGLATLCVVPHLCSFWIRGALMGRNRALVGSSQTLSLVPGLAGQYVRRAFLARVLTGGCASSAAIEFGVLFSQVDTTIEDRVYIGPRCHIGRARLGKGALIAAGVHIPSGPHSHGTDLSAPIHDQEGQLRTVQIGAGAWIGSNAVILADVGPNTIVGAGAVVTQALPAQVVAAGVPAKVVRRLEVTSVSA